MMREIVAITLMVMLFGTVFTTPTAVAESSNSEQIKDAKNTESSKIAAAKDVRDAIKAARDAIKEKSDSKDVDKKKDENKIFAKLVAKLKDLPKKGDDTPPISP